MIKLSPNNIQNIEMAVDENTVVEVHLTQEGVLITSRPAREEGINFPYAIQCSESPSELTLSLKKQGDYPVALGTFPLPANYWIQGIKGYKQE